MKQINNLKIGVGSFSVTVVLASGILLAGCSSDSAIKEAPKKETPKVEQKETATKVDYSKWTLEGLEQEMANNSDPVVRKVRKKNLNMNPLHQQQ
ncbi:hypothetical protein [Neobacillus drentensis]|uniref:hypothetical protein n=1 Tax=Neobacillus drentensis TaxID=220684 RepID=UPI003001117B